MREIFGVSSEKVHVVSEAVQDVYLNSQPLERGPWLVSTGRIHAVKRMVELAEAALVAKTPLWVIGQPHTQGDAYSERFMKLAREHPDQIRYEGFVPQERLVQAYRRREALSCSANTRRPVWPRSRLPPASVPCC